MVADHAFPLTFSGVSGPLLPWPSTAAPQVNRALGGPRRISLATVTPTPACRRQANACPLTSCRHHLGAPRDFRGLTFSCALDVVDVYPDGLAPVFVARLLGLTESEVQSTERLAAPRYRLELQRLKNEERAAERARAEAARERDRLTRELERLSRVDLARRPAPPAPAVEAPALVLTLCPPVPLRRRRTATPRPRRAAPPLPGQMAFPWAAAA